MLITYSSSYLHSVGARSAGFLRSTEVVDLFLVSAGNMLKCDVEMC